MTIRFWHGACTKSAALVGPEVYMSCTVTARLIDNGQATALMRAVGYWHMSRSEAVVFLVSALRPIRDIPTS